MFIAKRCRTGFTASLVRMSCPLSECKAITPVFARNTIIVIISTALINICLSSIVNHACSSGHVDNCAVEKDIHARHIIFGYYFFLNVIPNPPSSQRYTWHHAACGYGVVYTCFFVMILQKRFCVFWSGRGKWSGECFCFLCCLICWVWFCFCCPQNILELHVHDSMRSLFECTVAMVCVWFKSKYIGMWVV